MTPMLARAFAAASRLPADEQDALAAFVLETVAESVPITVHEPSPTRAPSPSQAQGTKLAARNRPRPDPD